MKNAQPNFGVGGPGFLRGHLAAENAEVCGLFADLGFRFHINQVNAGGEGITAGSGSFDQIVFSTRAFRDFDRFSYNGRVARTLPQYEGFIVFNVVHAGNDDIERSREGWTARNGCPTFRRSPMLRRK